MQAATITLPAKFRPLFSPARYKVFYGGRGGAKSWNFARALILLGAQKRLRVLCAREFQNSITDSVHKLLCDQIEALGLEAFYNITQRAITGPNGTEFIFEGLRHNVTKIKSMEGIDICWVEEAEKVSNDSWNVLIPTIRKAGSEIWVSYNPAEQTDPTHQRFVVNPPPGAVVVKVSYADNPWFPDTLRQEMEYLRRVDTDAYLHVWEGHCRSRSAAQVLNGKWRIDAFDTPEGADGPYFGADWGFSQDPTTLVKLWIKDRRLYVERELYRVGLEISDTSAAFRTMDGADKHVIRADNARPETISHVRKDGLNIVAADKWPGSVEDGIAVLRAFEEIVVHERCKHAAEEARLWSFKTDRLSGDVLPDLIDKHNHIWDAARYALAPLIKRSGPGVGFLDFIAQQKG